MSDNGNDRITVSRETLRAELTSLKLDLIQTLASKTEVERMDTRLATLETHGSPSLLVMKDQLLEITHKQNDHADEIRVLWDWRNRIVGAGLLLAAIDGIAVYALAHQFGW